MNCLQFCFNFASILLQFRFNFAFNSNLRRYTKEIAVAVPKIYKQDPVEGEGEAGVGAENRHSTEIGA